MNCEELKSHVLSWFGAETECRASGSDTLIATLPILKPNGDPIEIGIEPSSGGDWRLSDMGDTYAVLYLAGVEMYEEYVRAEEFRQIIKAHSIADEERELSRPCVLLSRNIFDRQDSSDFFGTSLHTQPQDLICQLLDSTVSVS